MAGFEDELTDSVLIVMGFGVPCRRLVIKPLKWLQPGCFRTGGSCGWMVVPLVSMLVGGQ